MSGEADLFHPVIYDNMTRVDLPRNPDYYASTDLTDKAITWVRSQHSLAPDKPFFVYYAAAGNHAPFQVPEKWRNRYKGKFDQGWDQVRRGNPGAPDQAGSRSPGHEARAQARRNSGMGSADARREEGLRQIHGDLCGLW